MTEPQEDLTSWLSVLPFHEAHKEQTRLLLMDIVHGLFILQLFYLFIVSFMVGWSTWRVTLLVVPTFLLCAMKLALKQGHVRLVAVLLPFLFFGIFAFLSVFLGGIKAHSFSFFGTMIVLVGIIWGGRGALLTVFLVFSVGSGLVWLEYSGHLPQTIHTHTPASALATYMLSFFLLLWLVLGDQRRLRAANRDANAKAAEIKALHDAAALAQANSTREFKMLLQEQNATTQQLRLSNEELTSFSHAISHDLRAPMGLLVGLAEALQEDFSEELPEEANVYVTRIGEVAGRVDRVVADLLRYSRLSRTALTLEQVTLEALFGDVHEHLSREIEARDARLHFTGLDIHVIGNHSILFQIVLNLLSNAIKFVPPGRQAEVKVWTERSPNLVKVWVEDNGIGIGPQYTDSIFRPFERLHGINDYPGTGLGLSIVRKGIVRLGGDCGVTSTLGEGSRFWFSLPLQLIPQAEDVL